MNGKEVRLWRADHAFQAVALPTGEWRAVLLYRPKKIINFSAAAALLATALSLAGLIFFKKISESPTKI